MDMAKRVFTLSEKEIRQFQSREQGTRDVYELKRLQAVRLYGMGQDIASIQQVVQAAESTIREWVRRYEQHGLAGLASQWQGGNANKLTPEQRSDLTRRLELYTPEQVIAADVRIAEGAFWTVSDLQMVLQMWYGVSYRSRNSYYNLLHSGGLSYQKAEKVYRSQPSAEQLAEFEAELEKK